MGCRILSDSVYLHYFLKLPIMWCNLHFNMTRVHYLFNITYDLKVTIYKEEQKLIWVLFTIRHRLQFRPWFVCFVIKYLKLSFYSPSCSRIPVMFTFSKLLRLVICYVYAVYLYIFKSKLNILSHAFSITLYFQIRKEIK